MSAHNRLYECSICDCYHPWNWNGDCRDDANRFSSPEDFEDVRGLPRGTADVSSMDERLDADFSIVTRTGAPRGKK